ncbi:sodium:calcium antiporter, partial [Candidatus Uhrbacteria bacterium]|nr:sodium:calcium antiporter [Candidatus Uhrbacteria bacterium]MBD3284218.1 sodium:calcium antiporter [Candidatus Uhrbacteria bacterium]
GGRWTVDGAVAIAKLFGLSDSVIGLTVVAIGTSLPELVTSIIAATKKRVDIAIGNAVGSNIFNVFWVLGSSATINALPFSGENAFDVLFAIFASLVMFVVLFIGRKHTLFRYEGVFFLLLYVGYITYRVFGV